VKVLIADKFEAVGLEALGAAGCDVVYQPDLKDAALAAAIRDSGADVLVVRGTAVTGAMLEGGALSLVVRAGAGYNTIDVEAASRRGIYVSTCPGKNAIAVAELAFGLILALDRRIPDNVAELRAGRWNKKEFSKARGLYGRTLGLIGYGSIARELARRAHAFGMSIAVWSRSLSSGAAKSAAAADAAAVPVTICRTPEEVASQADVLSVHLALTPETRGFVGASILDRLKAGASFINTARGEVVDQAALARAVRDRGLRAGLDVFAHEPAAAAGPFADPIIEAPGVYGTHHIGGSTDQAQEAIALETVRVIAAYQQTGKVPNAVNLARTTPATHALVVRHRDRPGVLAHVFGALRAGGVNVQETENVIFDGAQAAVARIHIDAAVSDAALAELRAHDDILDLHVVRISHDSDPPRT
jgi:D-3-phosphoglycerate dehydrogenase